MKIIQDPILRARNGKTTFYFVGLLITVLWIGAGSIRIAWDMDGKNETLAVSHDFFRELILN